MVRFLFSISKKILKFYYGAGNFDPEMFLLFAMLITFLTKKNDF